MINETGVPDRDDTFTTGFLELPKAMRSSNNPWNASNSSDKSTSSSKHPSSLDTAATPYKTPEYTVESLAGLNPSDPLAKQIVYALMGIEDASPAMIQDIMRDAGLPIGRSRAPSPEGRLDPKIKNDDYTYICACEVDDLSIADCPHIQGEVTVLEHEPGVNDIGDGGLESFSRRRNSMSPIVRVPISPQDRVACKQEWKALLRFQPNGLVSKKMLKEGELFEENVLERLPEVYHTTVNGLNRVLEAMKVAEEDDEDTKVYALAVRGGYPAGESSVIYAEDLIPYVEEGKEGYDVEFWESIEELRSENSRMGIVDLLAWAAL